MFNGKKCMPIRQLYIASFLIGGFDDENRVYLHN